MRNTTMLVIAGILILIVGGFTFLKGESVTGNAVAVEQQVLDGDIQQVILSEKNLNYYPSEVRVKANQPVEMKLDSSVKGCLRSVVFDLGDTKASKYLKTPDETLTFTPTKKGTFNFACSMGMGYGKLIVE